MQRLVPDERLKLFVGKIQNSKTFMTVRSSSVDFTDDDRTIENVLEFKFFFTNNYSL